jgi:hypothetical protein
MPLSKINTNSVANTANLSINNLGVGGSSSSYSIDVNAAAGVAGLRIYANTYPQIRMHDNASGNTSSDGILFELAPTYLAIANYEARPVIFSTAGLERFRIPSDAGGITFPATQYASTDANTLDDYEEGTFTPDARVAGRTSSWSTKVGKYIKIGRQVTVWCMFDGGNSGATDTYSVVSGLPFTPGAGHGNQTSGIWGANNLSPTTGNMFVNNGDTTALIMYGGGNQPGYFSYFSCMITYLANA